MPQAGSKKNKPKKQAPMPIPICVDSLTATTTTTVRVLKRGAPKPAQNGPQNGADGYVDPRKPNQKRRPLASLPVNLSAYNHVDDNVKENDKKDMFKVYREEKSPFFHSSENNQVSMESHSRSFSSTTGLDTRLTTGGGKIGKIEEYFSSKSRTIVEKEAHLSLIYSPPDFVADIYDYERAREQKPNLRPKSRYMQKQPHLTSQMRTILVDWMVDVAVEYRLEDETLHLAVNYVDRFLSLMVVDKEKLQLVGTTAMLIASKYEEIYPPELTQFIYITDDSYTAKQILRMERILLETIQFEMSFPTINFFLNHFLKICESDQRCKCLAKFLSELALLDVEFTQFTSSVVAASIMCVANLATENIPWPVDLEHASRYTISDIYSCMTMVLNAFKAAPTLATQAICDKYKENKYCQVALMQPPSNLPPLNLK